MSKLRSVAVVLALALALAVSGCGPKGSGRPACPASGCVVSTRPVDRPLYVPRCHDVDPGYTPACVDQVGDSGLWVFVPEGASFPVGVALALCPTEDGGPDVPCAWVPSAQGNGTGDSGAYVFGLTA